MENRSDVEKAVRTPPEQLLGTLLKQPEVPKMEISNLTKKRSESESSSDAEGAGKRQKLEGNMFLFV